MVGPAALLLEMAGLTPHEHGEGQCLSYARQSIANNRPVPLLSR
jgi:hypothetical protein